MCYNIHINIKRRMDKIKIDWFECQSTTITLECFVLFQLIYYNIDYNTAEILSVYLNDLFIQLYLYIMNMHSIWSALSLVQLSLIETSKCLKRKVKKCALSLIFVYFHAAQLQTKIKCSLT